MGSFTMVVAFDVFEDLLSCVVVIVEGWHLEGFAFEGGEKTFCWRVIPAIAFATHALLHAELRQALTKHAAAILHAAVRMKDGVVHRWLLAARHMQRV